MHLKNKQITLGITAFTFSTGVSLASISVNPVWVRVNEANPAATQQVDQNLCTTTGPAVCRVWVVKSGTANEVRTVYSSAAGTTALRYSSAAAIVPPIPIFVP